MRSPLVDAHDRVVDYLRLSIMQACNYACAHCDMEGHAVTGREDCLAPRDVASIMAAFLHAGPFTKVKLTGGEPLLHPDIIEIVRCIKSLPGIEDVSLTTNGYHLHDLAGPLASAGLDRINVSLCSLDKETYAQITGVDGLDRVIAGIDSALQAGIHAMKINLVLMQGVNDMELERFIAFCQPRRARLQLIELHEIDGVHGKDRSWFTERHARVDEALDHVDLPVDHIEYRDMQHRKIVWFQNGVAVEIIQLSPLFCENCTKIRVTASGTVKPCLMRPGHEHRLLDVLRSCGNDPADPAVTAIITAAIRDRHPFVPTPGQNEVSSS